MKAPATNGPLPGEGLPPLRSARSNWIRLRTLVILRWIAIFGQSAAIVVADRLYGMELPIGLCALVVGMAIIGNLFAMSIYPRTRRLREGEAIGWLLFDIVQLGALLFLTGGLNNPFAVLILAPVTIAATFLKLRQTILLGLLTIVLLSLVSAVHLPLTLSDGTQLMAPALFIFGFWLSLVTGVIFLSLYAHRIITEVHSMSDALAATQLALAREQKLTDLGGVVAAAAHELGTPLATIKLVSTELVHDLEGEQRDDAALIREQAKRCHEILRSMGRAGKDDLHLRRAPLEAVVQEAAEPHVDRGKTVTIAALEETAQPVILRRPEVIHGLRNLIQNAVDFATSTVAVDCDWDAERVTLRIADDGPGFPRDVLSRIGNPFVQRKRTGARPGYESMGLGLFIAKTLLERSGAETHFINAGLDREGGGRGAMVTVSWPRDAIEDADHGEGLGENTPIPV